MEDFVRAFPELAAYLLVALVTAGVATAAWVARRILVNQLSAKKTMLAMHAENKADNAKLHDMVGEEVKLLTETVHGHDVRLTHLEAINGLLPGGWRRRHADPPDPAGK